MDFKIVGGISIGYFILLSSNDSLKSSNFSYISFLPNISSGFILNKS